MYWLDIAKLAVPAAICAFFLGLRTASTYLVVMVTLMVLGFGFLAAVGGEEAGLGPAFHKVAVNGPPLLGRMIAAGAAGIIVGWWLRTWMKMKRSSPMTREPQSPI
jgi:hypothetical protein